MRKKDKNSVSPKHDELSIQDRSFGWGWRGGDVFLSWRKHLCCARPAGASMHRHRLNCRGRQRTDLECKRDAHIHIHSFTLSKTQYPFILYQWYRWHHCITLHFYLCPSHVFQSHKSEVRRSGAGVRWWRFHATAWCDKFCSDVVGFSFHSLKEVRLSMQRR